MQFAFSAIFNAQLRGTIKKLLAERKQLPQAASYNAIKICPPKVFHPGHQWSSLTYSIFGKQHI